MKSLLKVIVVSALLGGTIFAGQAQAGDKRHGKGRGDGRYERRGEVRYERHGGVRHDRRDDRYFSGRNVVVIRDYYRPYYRPLPPGLAKRYYRGGYLPPGWAKRVRPIPVYYEPELIAVPRGYHRGLIDGRAVVYNSRGLILDVAVLF